ncbi:hypothetical protein O3I44_00470 [Candidatus Mycoplasma mahonii]|nr:hypothetical protein [Candidatus Mycoplasma mahonii]WKX02542.1 hypothetical protein O3I44_00470 [Candidatus Mycoplasma mahonii]
MTIPDKMSIGLLINNNINTEQNKIYIRLNEDMMVKYINNERSAMKR